MSIETINEWNIDFKIYLGKHKNVIFNRSIKENWWFIIVVTV